MKNDENNKSVAPVRDWLEKHNYKNKIIFLNETARSAQEAADSLDVSLGQIAKSLIFSTKETKLPVLIIASGVNRVNEKLVSKIIGEEIERADAAWVKEITGFSIGGIPPIAHKVKPIVLFDEDLDRYVEIWAAAGHPYGVFKTTPKELLEMSGAKKVSIK
jgi:prolyl-tRNA editing enzyme YbaK/EbsC (Cys-tRNA(Pro) deacylase)